MALSVLPLDLARWDEAKRDALVLPVFKDDRPLRGAAGLADWRMCGRLSRLVKSSKATAEQGESLLLPPGRRLPFARVLWFGLGDAKGYSDERFKKDVKWILDVITKAAITDWAVQLPGRASGLIGARRAIEIVLDEDILVDQPVTLLEDPAGQKDIAEALEVATLMVAFPQLLEYATDRIHVLVDCDGNARLVETGTGVRREWTAKVALPHLHAAWAALVQSGFPSLPAGDRTLIAHRADGRKEGGKLAATQMSATLDALITQIVDDKADAVVTNIVRITS